MTPQELKNSILQLAIQGKLVEQRPEEGTAADLLGKIFAAKATKVGSRVPRDRKMGTCGRAGRATLPPIPDDGKPFDIPESWEWVRLGDVVSNHGQKKPTGDFSYIDIGSIDNKNQRLSNDETIVHAENASPRARKIVQKGDVIYATVRPYLHNVCVIDREFSREPIASTGFAVMACADCLDNKYLLYFLLSPDFDRYANSSENAKGVAYPAISDKRLYSAPIPLPPLAEQKRIVAKIEELLPLIDRYEKAWSKLEDFNRRFPVDMQKSVLQMAIQGKLVDQRPEEGTGEELYRQIQAEKQRLVKSGKIKKEKPPPEITEDEIPFDIPESWKWVRLQNIVSVLGDGIHGTPVFDETGEYYFVNGNNLVNGSIVVKADTKKVSIGEYDKYKKPLDENSILISINGTIGNYAFYAGEPIILGKSACYFSVLIGVDKKYIRHLLNTKFFTDYAVKEATQTTIKNVSLKAMRMFPIPLPPLAEQKRIVAKLEEILPLCERLK